MDNCFGLPSIPDRNPRIHSPKQISRLADGSAADTINHIWGELASIDEDL